MLGTYLLLHTHALIERGPVIRWAPRSLKAVDPDGTPAFYAAYAVMNTLFLCLACTTLTLLLNGRIRPELAFIDDLAVLFLCLLMAITQYVVTPYDMLSYFLLTAATWLIFRSRGTAGFIALCFVVLLATLTRESSALIMSFYVAVHASTLLRLGALGKRHVELAIMVAMYAATYVGLRIFLGFEHGLSGSVALARNVTEPPQIAGLVLSAALAYVLLADRINRRRCFVFLATASPYVAMTLLIANPWEVRLYVPVIMLLTLLKVYPPRMANRTAASRPREIAARGNAESVTIADRS